MDGVAKVLIEIHPRSRRRLVGLVTKLMEGHDMIGDIGENRTGIGIERWFHYSYIVQELNFHELFVGTSIITCRRLI